MTTPSEARCQAAELPNSQATKQPSYVGNEYEDSFFKFGVAIKVESQETRIHTSHNNAIVIGVTVETARIVGTERKYI